MPTAVEHGSVGRKPGGNATLQSGSRRAQGTNRLGLANSKLVPNIPARWVSGSTGSVVALAAARLTFPCDSALARSAAEGSVLWDPRYGLFIA